MADGIIKNLMAVIEAAEQLDRDTFEAEHIELDNGRSLLLVAITGENLDGMAMVMEGLCMTALESARARQSTCRVSLRLHCEAEVLRRRELHWLGAPR